MTKKMNFLPVVMSGGSGTRLWPVSRSKFPKQFCELLDQPLHTLTLKRLQKYQPPMIVTSIHFRDLTESDLRLNHFNTEKVIYEPQPKNTAPAIALVCRYLELQNQTEQVVGVFSSDNLIQNESEFYAAVDAAASAAAEKNQIVTLGIKPDKPETGFGYIQVQDRAVGTLKPTPVLKFHEKPTLDLAQNFLNAGTYFWNAGIFIFKVSKMIELFKKFEPEIWSQVSKLDKDFSGLDQVYASLKSISIDYAILEKLTSNELSCVTCDIGWSDLGSWDALADARNSIKKDQAEQLTEVVAKGNSIVGLAEKNYSMIGVDDLIVVDTADAMLICKKGESQKVKDIVDKLKINSKPEFKKMTEEHIFENRPWGRFEILKNETHYKSKIIRVDAGQKISYQSHAKRSEHWILVRGSATVVLNDAEILVQTGEHIFIPQGAKHRIMNTSNSVVEFIEVQVGSYFGEDDIVRYQDDYGRQK
jgi:mannose-1-phosphate guanylyltransferase/mannose-6-phosphate isomerase